MAVAVLEVLVLVLVEMAEAYPQLGPLLAVAVAEAVVLLL